MRLDYDSAAGNSRARSGGRFAWFRPSVGGLGLGEVAIALLALSLAALVRLDWMPLPFAPFLVATLVTASLAGPIAAVAVLFFGVSGSARSSRRRGQR